MNKIYVIIKLGKFFFVLAEAVFTFKPRNKIKNL